MAGVLSECMMLASFNETDLALLQPDKEMPLGTKISLAMRAAFQQGSWLSMVCSEPESPSL